MSRNAQGHDFDFLVVGSGVTAAVMANTLVARKVAAAGRVAVIEDDTAAAAAPTASESEWGPRVFALGRVAERLLRVCGAWQGLPAAKYQAYRRMCVWDARGQPDGAGSLSFDCAELGEPNLGFIVEGAALQAECRRAAGAAGVAFMAAGIEAIVAEDADLRIRLRDGRDLSAELLIAADGADSPTRRRLGIETAGHAYHQDALVAHVRTAKPHRDTAWQCFLPAGPLALLPMPDGRSSLVWSTAHAEAQRLRALDPAAFGAAVTAASGAVLGTCELTTPVAAFPLDLRYALEYVRPRAVLVGDAAHVVHPLAGQNLNLGMLDCASLAEVLGECADPRGRTDRGVLRRYERRRKAENLAAATGLDLLERLFASGQPALARLRMAGLTALGRMPSLKRRLAERALGLGGDVPNYLLRQ